MWHKARAQPSQSWVAGPTSLADRPGVGAFSNFALPMCQGRSVHGASNAQSQCSQETWPPGKPRWLAGLTSGSPKPHFWPKYQLNPL
jgi:hypothetical protein